MLAALRQSSQMASQPFGAGTYLRPRCDRLVKLTSLSPDSRLPEDQEPGVDGTSTFWKASRIGRSSSQKSAFSGRSAHPERWR